MLVGVTELKLGNQWEDEKWSRSRGIETTAVKAATCDSSRARPMTEHRSADTVCRIRETKEERRSDGEINHLTSEPERWKRNWSKNDAGLSPGQPHAAWHSRALYRVFTEFFFSFFGFRDRNAHPFLSTSFYRDLTEFDWVLPGFTGFYRFLHSFTEFYWILPSFTGFYLVVSSFHESSLVLLSFTGFYRVLLVLT